MNEKVQKIADKLSSESDGKEILVLLNEVMHDEDLFDESSVEQFIDLLTPSQIEAIKEDISVVVDSVAGDVRKFYKENKVYRRRNHQDPCENWQLEREMFRSSYYFLKLLQKIFEQKVTS